MHHIWNIWKFLKRVMNVKRALHCITGKVLLQLGEHLWKYPMKSHLKYVQNNFYVNFSVM